MIRNFSALLLPLGLVSALALSAESLDQDRVRHLYNEGDFDGTLDLIGRFRSKNPAYSRDDSICIAKHLAVVYAANPKSVGQGKYWMNELLKLMPAADLVGMYVSDEIDRIFEKVRDEFVARQRSFGVDTSGLVLPSRPAPGRGRAGETADRNVAQAPGGPDAKPVSTAKPAAAGTSSPGSPASAAGQGSGIQGARAARRLYWILGGTAAAAAVGATAYFLLASSGESEPTEVFIPKGPSE